MPDATLTPRTEAVIALADEVRVALRRGKLARSIAVDTPGHCRLTGDRVARIVLNDVDDLLESREVESASATLARMQKLHEQLQWLKGMIERGTPPSAPRVG